MSLALASLFVLSSIVALASNPDLFSPAKFYLFTFALFFGAAFIGDVPPGLACLCLLVLSFGSLAAFVERDPRRSSSVAALSPAGPGERKAVVAVWTLSAVPVAAFAYLVVEAGGIGAFVAGAGMRTAQWRGLGWAVTLMMGIAAINLAYFAVGLLRPRAIRWWLGFALHGLLTLGIVGASGSRSAVMGHLPILLMLFNYLHRRLTVPAVTFTAASLVVATLVLGTIREQINVIVSDGPGEVAEAWSPKLDSFSYGTQPLQRILDADPRPLAHGSTFLSLFTNAVPRTWWPGKPDSGGIFLTKQYFDDAWEGGSNVTPTLLGEWIINFDFPLGIVGFVIAQALLLRFLSDRYSRMCRRLEGPRTVDTALGTALYVCLLWAVVGLMVGEVTNVLLLFVFTRVAPIVVIRLWSRTGSPVRPACGATSFTSPAGPGLAAEGRGS
jgi:hypothetical protein